MNRRRFLKSFLAGAAVAAIPLSVIRTVAPELFWLRGNGITDDTAAMQALMDGKPVLGPDGQLVRVTVDLGGRKTVYLPAGNYRVGGPQKQHLFNLSFQGTQQ